jgi:hypothetical protein
MRKVWLLAEALWVVLHHTCVARNVLLYLNLTNLRQPVMSLCRRLAVPHYMSFLSNGILWCCRGHALHLVEHLRVNQIWLIEVLHLLLLLLVVMIIHSKIKWPYELLLNLTLVKRRVVLFPRMYICRNALLIDWYCCAQYRIDHHNLTLSSSIDHLIHFRIGEAFLAWEVSSNRLELLLGLLLLMAFNTLLCRWHDLAPMEALIVLHATLRVKD